LHTEHCSLNTIYVHYQEKDTPELATSKINYLSYISAFKTLWALKSDTPEFISDKATSKIKETINRLGMYTQCTLACF
jgi:hypothetical protein